MFSLVFRVGDQGFYPQQIGVDLREWPNTRLTCTVYGRKSKCTDEKTKIIFNLAIFLAKIGVFSSNQVYFHYDVRTRIQSWAIHWLGDTNACI